MKLNDVLSGLIVLAFGAGIVWNAQTFPAMPGQNIGPSFFPTLIGAGSMVLGAALAIGGVREPGKPWIELDPWTRRPRMVVNGLLVPGALLFYAFAVSRLGFFFTSITLLAVLFTAFGARRRWIAPIAVSVTLALHFAFYSLLRVPLQWGVFEGIAW